MECGRLEKCEQYYFNFFFCNIFNVKIVEILFMESWVFIVLMDGIFFFVIKFDVVIDFCLEVWFDIMFVCVFMVVIFVLDLLIFLFLMSYQYMKDLFIVFFVGINWDLFC